MGNEHHDRMELIRAEAERCVACGLCLPHCPTYAASRSEPESPRGRIALARGLATGALEPTGTLTSHLSSCAQCRACEKVCPAKVSYGRLIDETLDELAHRGRRGGSHRWLRRRLQTVLSKPGYRLAAWLRLYQKSGLRGLSRAAGLLRASGLAGADALLPDHPVSLPMQKSYPPEGKRRGNVSLFTGCVGRALDGTTLEAAIYLLTRLGYEVHVPPAQACCGALALHEGDATAARKQFTRTLEAFADEDLDAVISVASGCGATLSEYAELLPQHPAASRFAARVRDINDFLADASWPADLLPRPLPRRVAVQDPCTLRNVLKTEQSVYRLLARIPEIELLPLTENNLCCGGAGTYPLREPELAKKMADRKLRHLRDMRPELLVSGNIGCALHLGGALRGAELPLPVLHPVTLLARQLGWPAEHNGELAESVGQAVS
jgi:glycolate oxidase iron-sulfur subunit